MLAQNFKKPADLGITDAEFDALHGVLRMLERGELVHDQNLDLDIPNGFNMSDYDNTDYPQPLGCGTVCCIAGWCDRLFETEFVSRHTSNELSAALNALFTGHPINPIGKNEAITTAQAAAALRNYLTHGEARWAEALST